MNSRFAPLLLAASVGFLIASPSYAVMKLGRPGWNNPMLGQTGNTSTPAPQSDKGTANDVYKVGGDVSAPKLVHSVTPKFPEAARRASIQAKVLVNIYGDVDGKPSNVHVVRTTFFDPKGRVTAEPANSAVREGLEETAIEATKQYRFKPAIKGGRPVRVE